MIEIKLVAKLDARVSVPPSKSYTNRALIVAALAQGESVIENPLKSDDTLRMKNALPQFGVEVKDEDAGFRVMGTGGRLKAPDVEIYVGNAGTAMRFLATFAALAPGSTALNGDDRMRERPIGDLLDALNGLGIPARSINGNRCPPIEVKGGANISDRAGLRGDLSSQYLTSLLLSLPAFGREIVISIDGKLTSASYIDITLELMSDFGVEVAREGNSMFRLMQGQAYKSRRYKVPGDASSATYFFAAAAVTGGRVSVRGINPHTPQGDIQFLSLLERMGCRVLKEPDSVTVTGGEMKGVEIDMNLMPDAVPTAAVTALFARGATRIVNIGNLRIKETDRISALATELKKLGARVEEGIDSITIHPGRRKGASIGTYNDHRMAMSFAVAGLRIPGVMIENPGCVSKSFPDFFSEWESMRGTRP